MRTLTCTVKLRLKKKKKEILIKTGHVVLHTLLGCFWLVRSMGLFWSGSVVVGQVKSYSISYVNIL